MALHGAEPLPQSPQDKIQTTDFRRAQFYFRWMRASSMLPNESLGHYKSCKELVQFLNNRLAERQPDSAMRAESIKIMEERFSENIVPESAFGWLKSDERACYWLWGLFKTTLIMQLILQEFPVFGDSTGNYMISDQQGFIQEKNVMQNPTLLEADRTAHSHEERLEQIIYCFDISNNYPPIAPISFINQKNQFLKSKEKDWANLQKDDAIFKWLDKNNKEQCQWAWDYIEKLTKKYPIDPSKIGDYPPIYYLKPQKKNDEIYLTVCATYDIWSAHHSTKKLFAQTMGKAWSQKKFRSKNEENTPLNTYIKKDIKSKLDELARSSNKNIKDVLEYLILKEFDKKGE